MDNKRPKVGLGVYVLNDKDELLLLKRRGSHGEGRWCPPGGHLEYGESFEKCARREIKEEVGINIIDIKFMGATNDIFKKEDKHYITIAISAKLKSGIPKIKEPESAKEIGWFKLDKLPPLFLPNINYFKANFDCLCGSGRKYKKCHGNK